MSESANRKPNRLIDETSPYLLQHAHNPVDWYAWGPEALDRAKQEDLPILLSIGYSACHWCHVMERESFESDDIAKIMNQHYVSIKVDREERPDLDKVYQSAHQLFNKRSGGWPLTVVLTPDELIPIHVGTYYPASPRQGMPGFGELLTRIAEIYKDKDKFLPEHTAAVKDAFSKLSTAQSEVDLPLDSQLMQQAVEHLAQEYDPVFGGFSDAPKFPHPTQIELLLTYWQRNDLPDQQMAKHSVDMAVHTLEAMAKLGMYDHLGGGFYRYSVDAKWEIPHFEKMLYDTAQLMPVYVDAGLLTGRDDLQKVAIESGEWAMREMQSPDGGYYSAIDADSEGEEGKFYVWTAEELIALLSNSDYKVLMIRYGLRGTPNFEGKWHLRIVHSIDEVAHRSGLTQEQVESALENAHQKMFKTRSQRIPPFCDDKILASWNGLMIKAMARTGRYLKRTDFIDSAERALEFIRQRMWQNGRLVATARGDKAHLNAYLDDYAFVADAAIELLQARWNDKHLEFANALMEVVLTHFEDPQTGALYFTSDDHEHLLYRAVPTHDEATPSGNGVAAQVLLKLSYLTGDMNFRDAAIRIVNALQAAANQFPSAFGSDLLAIEEIIEPSPTLVIVGAKPELDEWANACNAVSTQNLNIYPVPLDASRAPSMIPDQRDLHTYPVAYLCQGSTCSAPCHSLETLLGTLPERKVC